MKIRSSRDTRSRCPEIFICRGTLQDAGSSTHFFLESSVEPLTTGMLSPILQVLQFDLDAFRTPAERPSHMGDAQIEPRHESYRAKCEAESTYLTVELGNEPL